MTEAIGYQTAEHDTLHTSLAQALWAALAGSPARVYAFSEAEKLASTLDTIAQLRATGTIDAAQAAALLNMQRHATAMVLMTSETMSLVKAQLAVNAALVAVGAAVEKAIGAAL